MGWIVLFAAALFASAMISFIHFICCKIELKQINGSYGRFVEVDGKKICVDVSGQGAKTIVLLTGLASPSPVLEMAPLAERLKDICTVVTIEYFGYGLSDSTKKERTIENIAQKIH